MDDAIDVLVKAGQRRDFTHYAAAIAAHAALKKHFSYTGDGRWVDHNKNGAAVDAEAFVEAAIGAVGCALARAALQTQEKANAAADPNEARDLEAAVEALLSFAQRLRQRPFLRGVEMEARAVFFAAA